MISIWGKDMDSRKAHVFSHVGNSRTLQQDNYLVGDCVLLSQQARDRMSQSDQPRCETAALGADDCVFVCDGMGGHAHGETASLTAVQLLKRHYDELIRAAAVSVEAIQDVISGVNEEFCQIAASRRELQTMGSTLCGVIFKDYRVYGINIGDSRLYRYRDGALKQITIDHTAGRRLRDLGFLTEDEARRFPNRKAIYKHLGQRAELRPDVLEIDNILPGTILMLATDGLTDVLTEEEIGSVLQAEGSDLKACGCRMAERAIARNAGFGDNITLILIEA